MKVNRVSSNQYFGELKGNAEQISKRLGGNSLDVIMQQKHNDVADIYVDKKGNISVKARNGYKILNKSVTKVNIDNAKIDFWNAYANCTTPSNQKVKYNFRRTAHFLNPKNDDGNKLGAALNIANDAYQDAGKNIDDLSPTQEEMTKAVTTLLNLKI